MDSRLKEEFLTCIICHEVFRDPVTLHCGHTICSKCVTAFTKTQHQAIAEQCIPCPHCRSLTKVPDPQQPVEQWAGQIKTGFFVKGLVDTFISKENVEVMCTPCSEDGEKTTATLWCSDCDKAMCGGCQKFHRRLMSSHSVSDLADRKTLETKNVDKKVHCEEHGDSFIDMMCQKCDVAVCPRCCIEKHKDCINSIVKLTDALPKINSVLEKRETDLQKNIDALQTEIPLLESQMETLQVNCQETEADINAYSMKVAAAVKTTLEDKLQHLKKEAMNNLLEDTVNAKESLQISQQNKRIVQKVLQSASEMSRYEVYKMIPRDGEYSRLQSAAPRILKFMLKQNSQSEDVEELGSIKPIFDKRRAIGQMSKAVLLKKVYAALPNDTHAPNVRDVIVMEVNDLTAVVVADMNNSCIKCFYEVENKAHNSYLQVQYPRSLVHIDSTKAAASVPEMNQIVIFSVTPDLTLDATIKTHKQYVGLCYVAPAAFVAMSYETGEVDVIDMSGNILRSLCPGSFTSPGRVCLRDPHTLLVTDTKHAHVRAITDQGESVFVYEEGLSWPRGLTRSVLGELFVVDRDSSKVLQFSDTGEFVREVLISEDGLEKPSGLFVDRYNKMYVAIDTGYVNVYSFM